MKKNIIKISMLSALIASSAIMFTGCSDMLDQKPQGQWTEDDIEGSTQSDVFSLYGRAHGSTVTGGNTPLAIHNFRSEDVAKGSTAGDDAPAEKMYDEFEYNSSNGMIKSYWDGNYAMIHIANDIIAKMSGEGLVLSDSERILKAEAHFFRAFNYFNLVRAFGDVRLVDFPLKSSVDGNIAKSPASEIYKLIDADLAEAVKYLPIKWDDKFIGRLTWGAARSLQARTFMMRNDWTKMHAAATDVINSSIYNLNTPFDKIFRETGENSSESIFELQCTSTESDKASTEIGSNYAEVQGVRGAGDWDLGWGWHTPTDNLANAFEAGDPRKDETLLYFARSKDEADKMTPNKPYGEIPIVYNPVVNNYYNKKAYTDPVERAKYTRKGHWFNIRIIRYADVVLMAAEAANEMGNTAEALKYLEQIRSRARGANSAVLPKVTTQDKIELQKAIRHERRIELAMEWDRFYDLVRWGTARDVLHAAGKTGYQTRHALLPLPQAEVDQSNGVLIQNPNY